MEENKTKKQEVTVEDLKKELFETRKQAAEIIKELQQKLEGMNYQNAFAQQQYMMEIVKEHNTFAMYDKEDIVRKAMDVIDNFWFKTEVTEKADNE